MLIEGEASRYAIRLRGASRLNGKGPRPQGRGEDRHVGQRWRIADFGFQRIAHTRLRPRSAEQVQRAPHRRPLPSPVPNGIIENRPLTSEIEARGHKFIRDRHRRDGHLIERSRMASARGRGDRRPPVVGTRHPVISTRSEQGRLRGEGSPLFWGRRREFYVARGVAAILEHTEVVYSPRRNGRAHRAGYEVGPNPNESQGMRRSTGTSDQIEKGGSRIMLKEIFESRRRCRTRCARSWSRRVSRSRRPTSPRGAANIDQIIITECGTS